MTDALRLDSIVKRFGAQVAIDDVSLTIREGEFVTILGPSGSGKSTTLRLIAGLDQPDSGSILIHGENVTELPPHRRECAMVFQDYALFPHLTVAENIGFGPRMAGTSRQETASRVLRLLDLVGLGGQGPRKPRQLSGGQQQRVALARALAAEPAVLLLDEPLGALDFALRHQMQSELRSIQRETGRAFVHVTHDQGEALALSDRVVVLNAGRIAQTGSPEEIYDRPANRFVARFMGFRNLLPVEIAGPGRLRVAGIEMHPGPGARHLEPPLVAAIRPERIRIGPPFTGSPLIRGEVRSSTYAGSSWLLEITLGDGSPIVARVDHAIPVGEAVHLSIDPAHVVVLTE